MTIVGPSEPGYPGYPTGPNAVTLTGGGQATAGWLIGNATLSRQGGTSASASSGGGGWQVTDRTRRRAATEWLDYYPFVMSFRLRMESTNTMTLQGNDLIDGYHVVPSVEVSCMILESFEVPVQGSYPPLPPIITVSGPVPHNELFWVCSRLSFEGDTGSGEPNQHRNSQGLRTMQVVSVELTEYSPTAAIYNMLTPAQQAAAPQSAPPTGSAGGNAVLIPSGKTYTVKGGDTLESIAANVLGNAQDYANLALLNGLSNSALLFPGTVLQLPAP